MPHVNLLDSKIYGRISLWPVSASWQNHQPIFVLHTFIDRPSFPLSQANQIKSKLLIDISEECRSYCCTHFIVQNRNNIFLLNALARSLARSYKINNHKNVNSYQLSEIPIVLSSNSYFSLLLLFFSFKKKIYLYKYEAVSLCLVDSPFKISLPQKIKYL